MAYEDYYEILANKLDKSVPRLSPYGDKGNVSETWMDYLKVLVPPELVEYLVKLETVPRSITLKRFAKKIRKNEEEALQILEKLIDNDCVFKIGTKEPKYQININNLIYNLPPLSYFKYPKEKAEKLANLSYKLFFEEEWYKVYSGSPKTSIFRVIPVQQPMSTENLILSHDDVEKLINNARILSLAKCMCKTRNEFLDIRECKDKYPLETCIILNQAAKYYIDRGLAREISKDEAKTLCKEFNKMGLIHTTENFSDGSHTLICNCCPCCCNPLAGITRLEKPHSVAVANYFAYIKYPEKCEKCEICVNICSFQAISMKDNSPMINNEKCMGCGVCVVNCPSYVIKLKHQDREVVPNTLMELIQKVGSEMD